MLKPLHNKIQLDIQEVTIGGIKSTSIEEHGTILAIGEWVQKTKYPIGSKLYFKTWAVDVITEGGEKYYFISAESDAICAIKNKFNETEKK